ncbi:hypothetical protein Avbf_18398, partial [Armadillidium vulgare]
MNRIILFFFFWFSILFHKEILYPIIEMKEEIEVKEETFYTKEENMESAQGFEGKYETLFIKEGVMEENGQDFGQSSGLDGSQSDICDVNYEDEEDTEFVAKDILNSEPQTTSELFSQSVKNSEKKSNFESFSEKKFKCDHCSFQSNFKNSLKIHLLRHTNTKLF